MKQLQGAYSLTMLCRVLAIRRSGYYAWRKRPVRGPSIDLQQQACEFHRRSRGAAGTRPLAKALGISRWRARRLMQTCQLVSKQPSRPKFRRAPAGIYSGPQSAQPCLPTDSSESRLVWRHHVYSDGWTMGLSGRRVRSLRSSGRGVESLYDSRYGLSHTSHATGRGDTVPEARAAFPL